MIEQKERPYRKQVSVKDLVSFQVVVKETDLWISADREFVKEARDLVFYYRNSLETYIRTHPMFLSTLSPYPEDPFAPIMIRDMIKHSKSVNVGPMASVAGAIAQSVCEGLLDLTAQAIVENGGDIYLKTDRKTVISIFAGDSPLSAKIGLVIHPEQMPLGVCSSSGTVGHSLSKGSADVVCVTSTTAILADAAATALGNQLQSWRNMNAAAEWAKTIEGLLGGVMIMGDKMATWGEVEIIGL
jgi:ApbE superfamily uncharacterized protein (UPF0280 family)